MDDGAVMDDRKLTAAKLWLVSPPPDGSGARSVDRPRDLPYLSHALYALVTVPAPEVPTMSCDEWWRVYVNEDWLAAASVPDVARELAHVVWHLLSDHTGRARSMGADSSTAPAPAAPTCARASLPSTASGPAPTSSSRRHTVAGGTTTIRCGRRRRRAGPRHQQLPATRTGPRGASASPIREGQELAGRVVHFLATRNVR